jgi:hypothetical protein
MRDQSLLCSSGQYKTNNGHRQLSHSHHLLRGAKCPRQSSQGSSNNRKTPTMVFRIKICVTAKTPRKTMTSMIRARRMSTIHRWTILMSRVMKITVKISLPRITTTK